MRLRPADWCGADRGHLNLYTLELRKLEACATSKGRARSRALELVPIVSYASWKLALHQRS
jgi:hypothetical protein